MLVCSSAAEATTAAIAAVIMYRRLRVWEFSLDGPGAAYFVDDRFLHRQLHFLLSAAAATAASLSPLT